MRLTHVCRRRRVLLCSDHRLLAALTRVIKFGTGSLAGFREIRLPSRQTSTQ